MGIFDSVTNLLAPAPAAPTQQAAPVATPGNIPDAATPSVQQAPATAPNGTVPAQVAPAQAAPDSPLAEFQNLWETTPNNSENSPSTPAPLDAAAVQAAVAKTNFSQSLTPETLASIAAGGEEAQAAFSQAMNQVAQQVMVQSTMVNNKLTEKAITDALAAQQANLPDMLRSQQAADHLKTSNPLFSNPAIKPVIEATQAQLLRQFPNATSAELTTMTQNYITQMGAAFAPQAATNDNSGAGGGTDWDQFMTL